MRKLNDDEKRVRLSRALKKAKRAEEQASKDAIKKVMIEKAICLRLMVDYVVTCSYGDIVMIIAMLRDYVRLCDEVRDGDIQYQAYYRGKFIDIADRLSSQIEYDYDEAYEKCQEKQKKEEKDSDVGADAIELAVRRR